MLSLDMIKDAKKRQQFILLDETLSRINVRDSQNIWIKKPEIVFNVNYRVAGLKDDFMKYLKKIFNSKDITNSLKNDIFNLKNYSKSNIFKKEMEDFLERRRGVININSEYDGIKISEIVVSSVPEIQPIRSFFPKGRSKKTTVSLKSRLADAKKQGKFLDVTNLKDNGTGSGIIQVKTTRKYKSETLSIISGNFENFEKALKMLDLSEDIYQEEIRKANSFFRGGSIKSIPKEKVVFSSSSEESLPIPKKPQASKILPVEVSKKNKSSSKEKRKLETLPMPKKPQASKNLPINPSKKAKSSSESSSSESSSPEVPKVMSQKSKISLPVKTSKKAKSSSESSSSESSPEVPKVTSQKSKIALPVKTSKKAKSSSESSSSESSSPEVPKVMSQKSKILLPKVTSQKSIPLPKPDSTRRSIPLPKKQGGPSIPKM